MTGNCWSRFVGRRDGAALEALVRRHGPMVWGVCRRVLGGRQDAEDAFQATFLVLVRKAASVAPREMVGNWLYGVAHRTALKARATAARRAARERQMAEMPEPAPAGEDRWADLLPLLDRELSRLPDKYRAVIVLCDLEGKTRTEVAGLTRPSRGDGGEPAGEGEGDAGYPPRQARPCAVRRCAGVAPVAGRGVGVPAGPAGGLVREGGLPGGGGGGGGGFDSRPGGRSDRGGGEGYADEQSPEGGGRATPGGGRHGNGPGRGAAWRKAGAGRRAVPRAKAPAPQPAGAVAGLPKDGAANEGGPAVKDDPARKELDKLNGLWACIGYEKDGVEHLGKEARRDQYHEELLFVADNATAGRLTLHWTLGRVSSSGAAAYRLHPETAPKGIDLTWQDGGIPEWGKGFRRRTVTRSCRASTPWKATGSGCAGAGPDRRTGRVACGRSGAMSGRPSFIRGTPPASYSESGRSGGRVPELPPNPPPPRSCLPARSGNTGRPSGASPTTPEGPSSPPAVRTTRSSSGSHLRPKTPSRWRGTRNG